MSDTTVRVGIVGGGAPIEFAARELAKYLRLIARGSLRVTVETFAAAPPPGPFLLTLCLFADAKIPSVGGSDTDFDDEIHIDVRQGAGVIAGRNGRSVLLAVYRMLHEMGIRWVRPGPDGEYLPAIDILSAVVTLHETPSYRHRGICIEGASSIENVNDLIDWAPKVGLNSYFLQFRESFTFFDRWYSHRYNPRMAAEPFDVESARRLAARVEAEVARRGLIYHAVGHGWTCEPFGIPGLGWDPAAYTVPPQARQFLALVNGKRELWRGIPLDTNLCYSNLEVRRIIVEDIAAYLAVHEGIDILHVWLADGNNNHCECENCSRLRPSDLYLMLLNELDEVLTARGIGTRIVFLIYFDLLWQPLTERLRNKDRFILMFAPFRTYSRGFDHLKELPPIAPFVRNKLSYPRTIEANVAFLAAWQDTFRGDSFDFDYHFYKDHSSDPGQMQVARRLAEDVKALKDLGLNGLISCQVQRAFFPTGLAMYLMGRALWDRSIDLTSEEDLYFAAAFGRDGPRCKAYLEEISRRFDPDYIRDGKTADAAEASRWYKSISALVRDFAPVVESNCTGDNECQSLSWRYLRLHGDICIRLAAAFDARVSGETDEAIRLWDRVKDFVCEHENEMQRVFDPSAFFSFLELRFRNLKKEVAI